MSTDGLHPSVKKFKEFVNDHPNVKEQLRKNHDNIQSYYEKWMILGEDDPFWESLPKAKKGTQTNKKDWMKQLGELMKDVKWEDVSRQIDELNGAIGQIQQLITTVQKENKKKDRQIEYPYY
ncbi:YlbD family protein [Halobacillus salinarum]|uniref:YlbD family protein n=1 Tax=Halobacillus salinarum TaxID=2932257 RepID=A0ABY4EI42_9BACI|nr:YlbD family protein [Halobacillus salinarum]UOQ43157.1 YlbD family protein [Halobacillus salinarum]